MLLVLMVSLGYQAILGIPVIHASHIFKLSSDDYFYLLIKDIFSFNLFVSWTREEFPYISYFVLRFKFCSFFLWLLYLHHIFYCFWYYSNQWMRIPRSKDLFLVSTNSIKHVIIFQHCQVFIIFFFLFVLIIFHYYLPF